MRKHKAVVQKKSGKDKWMIKCNCGHVFRSWRWHAEEQFQDHLLLNDAIEQQERAKARADFESLTFEQKVQRVVEDSRQDPVPARFSCREEYEYWIECECASSPMNPNFCEFKDEYYAKMGDLSYVV